MSYELFSLGKIYPSDFLKPNEQPRCEPIELKLVMEENGLVHLSETAPKEVMWGKYFYRSGINATMKAALKDVVDSILQLMKFKENDIWLDIACNDGTLLSFVPKMFFRVGIDPAEDSYKEEALRYCDFHIQNYFSRVSYNRRGTQRKAKVVTSIAMFYDVENPEEFIKDVYEILEDDGLWVMQLSYSMLMIKQLAFDNIVHEHYYYYNFLTIQRLLSRNGFRIVDCQLNDVNGGSFRLYIMKDGFHEKFGTQPYRDVCEVRVDSLEEYENWYAVEGANNGSIWLHFHYRIKKLKDEIFSFIKNEKEKGKTIWGYGASTKGNTLLQYFGLDNSMIDGIAEKNIDKWGLRTVGTNIPIFSESDMRKAQPDYLLILPWHFISEFQEREQEYLNKGGKFIVPLPSFQIIEK